MRRIQRKRTKGWKMPEGVVYVGRPTKWGNPFTWPKASGICYSPDIGFWVTDRASSVKAYRIWLGQRPDLMAEVRRELAGKDLACWCPPSEPCHADVLLAVAAGGAP